MVSVRVEGYADPILAARVAETAVAVLLATGAVAQNAAGVVHLGLANGPAVITYLEVPERVAPAVEFITSCLVPTTAIEAIRHSGKVPSRDALFCRDDVRISVDIAITFRVHGKGRPTDVARLATRWALDHWPAGTPSNRGPR